MTVRFARLAAIGLVVLLGCCTIAGPAVADGPPPYTTATPEHPNGWATQDVAPLFAGEGPGAGHLVLDTAAATDRVSYLHAAGAARQGVPLASVSQLFLQMQTTGRLQYELQIHTDGPAGGIATSLIWALGPSQPTDLLGVPVGVQENNMLQFFSISSAAYFRSTRTIPGLVASSADQPVWVPLSDIVAANPDATVNAYGVSQGPGAASESTVGAIAFDNDPPTLFGIDKTATTLSATPFLLSVTGAGAGAGSSPAVSARLVEAGAAGTAGAAVTPLADQPVVFTTRGTALCSAVTDDSGYASCTPPSALQLKIILNGGYDASYVPVTNVSPFTGWPLGPGTYLEPSTGHAGLV